MENNQETFYEVLDQHFSDKLIKLHTHRQSLRTCHSQKEQTEK